MKPFKLRNSKQCQVQATEEEKELVKKFPAYKQYQEGGPPKLLPSMLQIIGRQ